MKILVTGRHGPLYKTVAGALQARKGFEVMTVAADSRLLEIARARPRKALVFVLHTEEEVEPLRWVLQQNRSLPLVAVLPRHDANLEKQLQEEGVSRVIAAQGLTPPQLRQALREALAAFGSKRAAASRSGRPTAAALHAIRSTLTAILGNAELALKKASAGQKQQLQEIARGVAEIEGILRRLERDLGWR